MFRNNEATKLKPCGVCELLEGDISPKVVQWCKVCQAWLCPRCQGDWGRRLKAASMKIGFSRAI